MVMAELPIYSRARTTTDDDGNVFGPAGSIYTGYLTDLGHLQLTGMYTGFSPDMSTWLSFGVKLPRAITPAQTVRSAEQNLTVTACPVRAAPI
jgi:hypothetical protein